MSDTSVNSGKLTVAQRLTVITCFSIVGTAVCFVLFAAIVPDPAPKLFDASPLVKTLFIGIVLHLIASLLSFASLLLVLLKNAILKAGRQTA